MPSKTTKRRPSHKKKPVKVPRWLVAIILGAIGILVAVYGLLILFPDLK